MRNDEHTYNFKQHKADGIDDATIFTESLEPSEHSSDSEELEEGEMSIVNESPLV